MKKSLLALASLSAFTVAAHAQSSVTIYGIIDEAFVATSNADLSRATATNAAVGARRYYLDGSFGLNGTRWGFKGMEDLGGGLKAVFVLENGFNPNTGGASQAGLEFGRQAFVGLGSNTYGTVTMGRQYDSVVDYIGPMIFGDQIGSSFSAHPADLDNANNAQRVNNAIKYTSATYNGLTFGGLYSLGGVAGQFSRNQVYSLGAHYGNGPINLATAYLHAKDPNTSFFSNSALSSGIGAPAAGGTSITSPVYSGYMSANSYQVISAAGAYTVGPVVFGVVYANTQFQNLDSGQSGVTLSAATPVGTARFNTIEATATYHITPALSAGVDYSFTGSNTVTTAKGAAAGGAHYNQYAASVDYALSKRTDVYALASYQMATGTDSSGQAAVASINGLTPSSNGHQAVTRIGLRVKF
jgi:predicted porin